jgi:hypothetical protein
VHDFFDIVGVASDARPIEIRRACCRRVHASHPDIRDGDDLPAAPPAGSSDFERRNVLELGDAAIDFIDAATLVEGMRLSFFTSRTRREGADPRRSSERH